MTIFFGIILALLIFSVIVFFHELGHFGMAKRFGVKVDEFGIGIPPRAKQVWKDKSGTIYTFNWLPIGGFVKMKGEEMNETGAHDKDSLASKNFWQQSTVILAGVIMNFFFAFVIFSTLFMVGVEPLGINTKFQTQTETKLIPSFDEAVRIGLVKTDGIILSPLTGSIAEKSGILDGDILLSIDGKNIQSPENMITKVKESTIAMNFVVRGSGGVRTLSVTPEDGKVGSYVGYNVTEIRKDFRYRYGFFESIQEGGIETYKQSAMTLELLGSLVKRIITPRVPTERTEAVQSLGGPIAIGNLFVNLLDAKVASSVILLIAALISINLGVFNLLPFPALDGGRFVFLIIHRVVGIFSKKKALQGKIESSIHIAGFSLLILLSIFVAYQDIVKIILK
ncbi:MAG: site-2 protease family protein [Candidatus Gracilibacteria bacterium]|nr:site-2 protease family protein [Candidatus Gracilibacteria bacterium]